MATPNFARPQNASKYFVVLTGEVEYFEVDDFLKSNYNDDNLSEYDAIINYINNY